MYGGENSQKRKGHAKKRKKVYGGKGAENGKKKGKKREGKVVRRKGILDLRQKDTSRNTVGPDKSWRGKERKNGHVAEKRPGNGVFRRAAKKPAIVKKKKETGFCWFWLSYKKKCGKKKDGVRQKMAGEGEKAQKGEMINAQRKRKRGQSRRA